MFADEPLQEEPIRVCLRLRPLNKFELSRRSTNCVTSEAAAAESKEGPDAGGDAIKIESPLDGEIGFTFDKVFREESTQADVYDHAAAPLASHALEGFSCALLAYGQTGSGKTHTMMGEGTHAGSTPSKKATSHGMGMIHRLIKDIFRLIKESPPTVEYILRCSFVEIHLEKMMDLLNPANSSIQIVSGGGDAGDGIRKEGVQMQGATEACCFDESDVLSLLVRGNACRTVSATKATDSSRSHAIFVMKIEQKDTLSGISKVSQLRMIDMGGSELSREDEVLTETKGAAIHQEAKMVNKSLALLHSVVKTVVENQGKAGDGGGLEVPYKTSKLTHLLKDAFGGNCRTSVILTASPASYNVAESVRTMKFGRICQGVKNYVAPDVEMSPTDYRKLLNDLQKKQHDLVHLVNELSAECFQLKKDAVKHGVDGSQYAGPLWKTVEAVLVNGADSVAAKRGPTCSDGESAASREELTRLQKELEMSKEAREKLDSLLAERQTEVAVLKTQIDNYASDKKRDSQALVSLENEMRLLTQRKQEVEHNLRTSQFREYEATVFLRQFRRFYRRLLRNKAHQGTGGTSEVIERVPGVPDLNDLIDVDSLLLEAGLIEESELHDDTTTGAYRPSAQALGRSTEATKNAWKEAALHGKVDELEAFDQSSLGAASRGSNAGAGAVGAPYGQIVSIRQQFLGTPAGRLATQRGRELERDLLRATERCIELQVALNEEKANVDILTNRAGNVNKKKIAQESTVLKQQLDKKTHDLQAIIWKMNELHLINKTYNEKMANREQHVTYLEENLVELQGANRNMLVERKDAEGDLRGELDNLKVLVDAMTVPLWQFGERGGSSRTLASRIRLPVASNFALCEEEGDADGSVSLESFEGSEEEDDEEEEESDDEWAEVEAPGSQPRTTAHLQDASTQTSVSSDEKGTMTAYTATPQHQQEGFSHQNGASSLAIEQIAPISLKPLNENPPSASRDSSVSTMTADGAKALPKSDSNGGLVSEEHLFFGGKTSGSQPRRSVHKFGMMIRPGVLKESLSKAGIEKGSSS